MSIPKIQTALSAGEISPDLYGRVDLDKYARGCSTLRNFFVSYRGGASSRAGTKFVGQCKQPASSYPPVLIPFQFSVNQGIIIEAGQGYFRFAIDGAYVLETAKTITGITNANPGIITVSNNFADGDGIFIAGVDGITGLNGRTFIVANRTSGTITLQDPLTGADISTVSLGVYTGGGTAARIYTLATPYVASDLPLLKWAQSADVMSLTHPSYPPYDLERIADDNWTLTQTTFATGIGAPTTCSLFPNVSPGTASFYYDYVATAVSASGEESTASAVGECFIVNISSQAGTINATCTAVPGAVSYNFYRAIETYAAPPLPGSLSIFGYVGNSLTNAFSDSNITPDFTKVPPVHNNPFPGANAYPGCVSYFQERRFYANTNNNPDTYYASQPGAFTNMDSSIPVSDSDAITGTPWSQQVNGIQWMINMPGGLVILTGSGAWQLSGGGGGLSTSSAITPSNQVATPQAYNGVSPIIRPITINYDVLYVQEKGSKVRDLSYNFFVNIYTGTDMTVLSNHLFDNHTIVRWDWAEEPYKLVWAIRDDGILLCLTYLKEQDVYAWSRHDTNGLFQSVAVISEPPVNAPYFVVKRLIQNDGNPVWAYYLERMDNRLWNTIDDAWCVDCGLSYPQNEPSATLSASSAAGVPTLNQPTVLYGGANYGSQTYAQIIDATGTGANIALTISGGVITAAAVSGTLTGYTAPVIQVTDPSGLGGGAKISITVNNVSTLTASSGVFTGQPGFGAVGDVVNMGNGLMSVASRNSSASLTVNVLRPITQTVPNDPLNTPVPAIAGDWSIVNPVSTVSGLNHLEGMQVSCLADGVVVEPQTVANGSIILPEAAGNIVVGLGYTCQVQTLYLNIPGPVTDQGRRKTIYNVVARVSSTAGPFEIGTNQPDSSTQPGGAVVPWSNMSPVETPIVQQTPLQPFGLFTGDIFTDVFDQVGGDKGQVAIQQTKPLPMNLLAVIPWAEVGDQPA